MGLFGIGKKKEEEVKSCCCCGTDSAQDRTCGCEETVNENKAETVKECCCRCKESVCNIQVLGSGCKSCHQLYENVRKAVAQMDLNAEVEYVIDMEKVMNYGVMSMPAIVVNEQVVSMGKVLKPSQVEELLNKLGC